MAAPTKGQADYLRLGDWNATCSMCGRKKKASELVRNWQGMWRCPEHNEPRHPQDFVRAVPDIQTPPWTQPESDAFVGVCSVQGISAVADYGVADCMVADYIYPGLFDTGPAICTTDGSSGLAGLATPGCSVAQ